MNFFESQERSRKHTTLLVILFAVAVLALIVMTNLLVMVVFGFANSQQLRDGQALATRMDWKTFAVVSAGVGVVVLGGSLYKIVALAAGGKVVAESLDGQLIAPNTENLNQRKLLNVVEEMAIASGTPAPPVYLLASEPGINAFAAGFSPSDAVLGVTQGAIDQLSRDQLQGVIAHEFSHIFNGDMRLNIRLMGALNGILILGILGYYLLYSTSFSSRRRDNDKGGAPILALAVGLMVIGFAGTFFGGLIKAAVSRQREYLADASAVQFTRNPDGIGGALKRIGGFEAGSRVENPGAPEVSHAFFAQGVSGVMQWLSATHPPLAKRILRIDPQWDGKFDLSGPSAAAPGDAQADAAGIMSPEAIARHTMVVAAGATLGDAMAAIDHIGTTRPQAVLYARALLSELPPLVRDAAREPYGARALIYAMLLDQGPAVREQQLRHLHERADAQVYALTLALMAQMAQIDVKFRLPLMDIAIPALKQLSLDQYLAFKGNLVALTEMDSRVDLFEWSLQKIVLRHLERQFVKSAPPPRARYADPAQLRQEFELVLSLMAHAGAIDQAGAQPAFDASVQALGTGALSLLARDSIAIADLDRSLERLDQLTPSAKSRLLTACIASIWHDQRATPVEAELLRAFASVLDCPMPPTLPQ